MNRTLVAVLMGVSGFPAQAQLNESDTTRLQVRVALTAHHQAGNVEVFTLRGRFDFTVSRMRVWVVKSQNSSLYQTFYSVKADSDLFSRNYLYYRPERRVYPFAIAYVSANYRRKIAFRYFAGAGLTAQLIRTPRNGLKIAAGVVHEHTRFATTTFNETAYNGSPTIALWRGTTWLGGWHSLPGSRVRLYYDAYWQPAFRDVKNYRWQADVGVDVAVWKGLSFSALYSYTHENVVATRVQPDDNLLTVGLAYTLRTTHR